MMRGLTIAALALVLLGAAPPSETATTAAEDEAAQIDRREESCCATLQREFDKSISRAELEAARKERRCCPLIAGFYEKATEGPADKSKGTESPVPRERSFVGAMVQMVLVLGSICLLAYLVLGKLLPRLLNIQQPTAQKRILTIVDRLPIDQRRSIVVLQIGALYFLVGITEQGISLISRLERDDVESALADAEVQKPALNRLASVLVRRSKES
jgi:flagellar biogenesis protein FliO